MIIGISTDDGKNGTLFIAVGDVNQSGCFGKQFGISQKVKYGVTG